MLEDQVSRWCATQTKVLKEVDLEGKYRQPIFRMRVLIEVEPAFEGLRRFNLAMGFILLFKVPDLALGNNYSLPIYASYVKFVEGHRLVLQPQILFTLP